MSRRVGLVLALLLAGALAVLSLPVLMLMVVLGGEELDAGAGCLPTSPDVALAAHASASGLSSAQLENAAAVVAVGNRMDVPRRGIVIALAVALQESRLLNYANDGQGDDLTFLQEGIEASIELPHQAVGSDHGSLGIFQQQWPWWGSMAQLMDPAVSAHFFYRALLEVPGWERMPVTVAGQAVQRSAYPDAYADDQALAEQLLDDPGVSAAASTADWHGGGCVPGAVAPGTVVSPIRADGGAVDRVNFGSAGGSWARTHTGTDFSASCGTPVVAAHGGQVIVRTDQPWAGPWLVQVSTGPGSLTTWYAHLQRTVVNDGDVVEAGEVIGEVGTLGNSTGCHLHFEVHPRGGAIYEDSVDPSVWLARNVGRELPAPGAEVVEVGSRLGAGGDPASPGAAGDPAADGVTRVATFNVLGHSHTRPGGNKPRYASSERRMRGTVAALRRHGVDVVALQELERVQHRQFARLAGPGWGVFRGSHAEAVAWRKDAWSLVRAETVQVPYFHGKRRRMPVVTLRDRSDGAEAIITSFHNPASVARVGDQSRWRAVATRIQVDLAEQAREAGVPILVLGDLNERHAAFCEFTRSGALVAAAGGSHRDGDCRPPAFEGIDWIFGSAGLRFHGHRALRAGIVGRLSDHPLVVSDVE